MSTKGSDFRQKLREKYHIGEEEDEEQLARSGSASDGSTGTRRDSPNLAPARKSSSGSEYRQKMREKYGVGGSIIQDHSNWEEEESFISSFLRDSRKYMEDYGGMLGNLSYQGATNQDIDAKRTAASKDLTSRADTVISYLNKNKSFLNPDYYKSVVDYVQDFRSSKTSTNVALHRAKNYYSQWENEYDYDAYLKEKEKIEAAQKRREEMLSMDLDAGEQEISRLKNVLSVYDQLNNEVDKLKRFGHDDAETESLLQKYGSRLEELRNKFGAQEDVENSLTEKTQYISEARRLQDAQKKVDTAVNDSRFTEMSVADMTNMDVRYRYINDVDFRKEYESLIPDNVEGIPIYDSFREAGLDLMSDHEKKIYNYYFATEGAESAEEYLESIQESLNTRKAQEMFDSMDDNTLMELVFGVEAGFDQWKSGVANLLNKEGEYMPASARQIASGMVREDLADDGWKMPDWMGGASLGQMGYDAITTTANMAPSILTSTVMGALNPALGAVAGNAVLGASVLGQARQEALNLGYEKEQADSYASMVAASEVGLNYLLGGISKLGGVISGGAVEGLLNQVDNAILRVASEIGGNMLSEGLEEGLQEIMTTWFKNIALNQNESVNWSDALYSGLLGALTAGVFEGSSVVSDAVNTHSQGRQIIDSGIGERLMEVGKSFDLGSAARELADKVNVTTDAYTMGRLFREVGAGLSDQNKADIAASLVSKGMDQQTAVKNAQVMEYIVEGGEVSDLQMKMIQNNSVLADTMRELIQENSGVNQRNRGYSDVANAMNTSRTNPARADEANLAPEGNLPTEENVDLEASYEPETLGTYEDGKTYQKSTNAEVTPKRITSIQNGKVMLETQDNRTVDASDVEFGDQDYNMVFRSITSAENMTPTAANTILQVYEKTGRNISAGVYAMGAAQAYRHGYYGMDRASLGKSSALASNLAHAQVDMIYQAGRQAAAENARAAQMTARNAKALKAAGKVHYDGDVSALTERQRVSLSALEKVSEATGLQFHIFESKVDASGRRVGANGWYNPSDNSIHIDLHAGSNGEGTMLFTASHELTHHIKKWSPEKFKALSDFLMTEYGEKGINADELVAKQVQKAKDHGRDLSYDQAFEEVVADSMETMLADGNVVEKLAKLKQQDRTLWQKVKDFISELAAKIRSVYEGLTADSVEGRYVAEMKDAIEGLQDLFLEGLDDAATNYQAAMERGGEQKNTAGEGGVKYQERPADYDFSKPFSQQLADYQNGIFPTGDTFVLGGTPTVLKKIGLASLPMTINQKHVNDALNGTYKGSSQEKLDHTFTVQELSTLPYKIADPIAIIHDKRTGKAKASESNIDVLVEMKAASGKQAICAVQIGGNGHINGLRIDTNKVATVHGNTDSIVRLTDAINETVQGGVAVFYLNNKKTTKVLQSTGNPIPSGLSNLDGFINSISDSGSPVKPRFASVIETQQFKRWFGDWRNHPQNASKVINDDGTPKIMYHGSPAQFTIFDKRKAKSSGLYGKGFYFTDSASHASAYGNQYAVYLNIRNPLEHGRSYVDRKQVRKYLDAVAENEDYSIENYGTYDVGAILKNVMGNTEKMDAFKALQDINATAIGDLVEAVELFNSVNGTDFDGIVVPTEIVAFRSEQIKSATDNIGTFDGSNPDIRYSDRDTNSVSNRALLANALESTAQTPEERQKLAEYRKRIETVEDAQRRLDILNRKIREASFAPGKRDTAKIAQMRKNAEDLAGTINWIDKKLLSLEASAPLKAVLEREKKNAYKRAEQKGKDALKAYREKEQAKQQEITKHYQEARTKGIESRRKTAMRAKVKSVVQELNQYLLRGTKEKHVPIELQKAVAEALDAVNMDTVGAEERIAKLRDEMANAKTTEEIQEIAKKIENVQGQGDRMDDRLRSLRDAYNDFIHSEDPLVANAHDEVIAAKLEDVIKKVGDTPLRDMSLSQLEDVYDMYKMVLTTIRNANKAFKSAKKETIAQMGMNVIDEVKKTGGEKKYGVAALEGIKKFGWNNLKPVYAFEAIGSGTFNQLFKNVRAGEDVWARDVVDAREFYLEKSRKYKHDFWDFKKNYTFESTSGMKFRLNLEQIMSLYAYSKREQAAEHLRRGGIVIDETTEVTMKNKLGIPVKFNPTEATAYNISDETLIDIVTKLTAEQKAFVDDMQEYLSTVMGEKGNEISLEMYGVKLFKEKNYFPLKSASQFLAKAKEQQKGEVKIKNSGFSKETVKNASNPVVLTPFMNVWADHVNDMSMYHAFVLPLEDFYRVYNFKTAVSDTDAVKSVEMTIQNAYGKGATGYIEQLLKDLNGGARVDSTTGIINKGLGLFKKGAVFASASVVIQQPSAIARAAALVDIKYFTGRKVDKKRHKELWAEIKKYAPVAIIKEMGYFDTNMGKSTRDFLTGKEYENIGEKMKALFTDGEFRDEVLSKAPALADELAWCAIWEAVQRETIAKHPGFMTQNPEAFKQLVGARFTEVITKTQVYDSVLARSANMRAKDTGMKMATAFMAEPTTAINMVADALIQGKRGNKKYARKAIGSVIAAQILNSILVSFVYAARDDDEDETYVEKYLASMIGNTVDGMNPLTYVPFLKDAVSIAQGYEVERSDMSVISDLWNAWQKLGSDNLSVYRKVEGFGGSIAQIFGLPLKNIMRDVRAAWQVIEGFQSGYKTTKTGIGYAIREALYGEEVSKQDKLYEALTGTDPNQITRAKAQYADEDAVMSAMKKAVKERYLSGEIDTQTASRYLVEFSGMDSSEAWWAIDEWNYVIENGTSEDYSKYGRFYEAVESGKDLKNVITDYTSKGVAEKTLSSQITSHFKDLFVGMTAAERSAMRGKIVNALVACGVDQEDAEDRVANWEFEAEYGFAYEDREQAYKDGKITATRVMDAIMEMSGKTEEEAAVQVEIWNWEMEIPDCNVTQAAILDYYDYCEEAGIPKSIYYQAWRYKTDTEPDYDEEGNSIAYSVVKKVMPYIGSLNLTDEQKDALALAWWAASTVNKYKTW